MIDRSKLMTEITRKMTDGRITPNEGWHCLKAVSRHMTTEEHMIDEAYCLGVLDTLAYNNLR